MSEFGGLILRLLVPDKNGNRKDIVLGYDKLQEYIVSTSSDFINRQPLQSKHTITS